MATMQMFCRKFVELHQNGESRPYLQAQPETVFVENDIMTVKERRHGVMLP
jgi:hypothetical protein